MRLIVLFFALHAYGQIRDIVAVSAASFESGVPPKGSLAAVLCTGLTGINGTITANELPLPTALAGVQVKVGGVLAPLLAVTGYPGYQQVNLQVPHEAVFEAGPVGTVVEVSVMANGQSSSVRIPIREGPGDFFQQAGAIGIFQHAADYSLVTAQNPARPGEAIVGYLTGLPGTNPVVPTGFPAPLAPLAAVPNYRMKTDAGWDYFDIDIQGTLVEPAFLGLTPLSVGVYQLNFIVPGTAPRGLARVSLVRNRCAAFFGSCINGGGTRTVVTTSSPVGLSIQ